MIFIGSAAQAYSHQQWHFSYLMELKADQYIPNIVSPAVTVNLYIDFTKFFIYHECIYLLTS